MKVKGLCYSLLVSFLIALSAIAQEKQSTNIALITDKTSGLDKSPLVSLLEVELSQREGIKLLERAAIDKILEEHQLSAAGLLDRNAAIKIGKLLRADAFIILSLEKPVQDDSRVNQPEGAGDLIRVRVAETAHGLRLLDYFEQPDSTNPKEAVERIIKKLEAILNKINQPDEKMIPVGIVDIHRVQLGEQFKILERTLPVMLSVRLSLEPQIIMLEREDLKVLLDEKLRTEGEDSKFWNSAVLIEGYLQPNSGHLEMHLNLKQAAGDKLKSFTVQVEPNEPSVAIAKATTEIIQQLQNSPPLAQWQPEQEAEQFYKQGMMFTNQQRYERALSLFEIAYSLQPQNFYYTKAVFNSEWSLHKKIKGNEKPQYSDLELAEIVSIYVRQMSDWYERGDISMADVLDVMQQPLVSGIGEGYLNKSYSVSTETIKNINRENRKIWEKTVMKVLEKFPQYERLISITWASSDDPVEVFQKLEEATSKISPDKIVSSWQHFLFQPPVYLKSDSNKNTQFRDSADKCWELWMHFLQRLTESKDPLIKFTSCLAMYKHTTPQDNQYRKKAIEILKSEINMSKEPYSGYTKQTIRRTISSYLTNTELEEFLKPLIENKDIPNLLLWDPGQINQTSLFKRNEQWYYLLEQIVQIMQLQKSDPRVTAALNRITETQYIIQKRYPQIIRTSQKQSNYQVTKLLKREDWPANKKTEVLNHQIIFQDKILWIAFRCIYSRKVNVATIFLTGINLVNKKPVALWQTDIPYTQEGPFGNVDNLSGIAIAENITYVSHYGTGIVEFPGASVPGRELLINPKILAEKQGLPSIKITSIEKYKNKLYVAYGDYGKESGLGLYDPQTNIWETVFCSSIKGSNPFSEGGTYKIEAMLFDKKNSLFFCVSNIERSNIWRGLWRLNTETRELIYLGPVNGNLKLDSENKVLLMSQSYLFTVESDSYGALIVLKDTLFKNIITPPSTKYLSGIGGDGTLINYNLLTSYVDLSFPLYNPGKFDMTTGAVHNNTLWARLGDNRIFMLGMGQRVEDANIIDNNILDGEPVHRFVSTPYGLVGIGEGVVGLIETGD